jgi:signal transduction histidine kinase
VDNAFQYGTTLTEIRRRVYEIPDGLVIVIEDNGVGIPQDHKERIFEEGFGESPGHSHSLFLAREILSITDITIRETGRAGKGARFEIQVPKGMYRVFLPAPEQHRELVSAPDFIPFTHHNHTL